MIQFLLKRILFAIVKISGLAIAILALIEVSYCTLGGSGDHVWMADSFRPLSDLAGDRSIWNRIGVSTIIFFCSYGLVLLVGYGWGILGARLRRFRITPVLASLFSCAACAPGFWLIALLAHQSLNHEGRPGYADQYLVEEGSLFVFWWHVALLATLAGIGWVSWMITRVSVTIREEATAPYTKALYVRGYSGDTIFYGNVISRSLSELISHMDKPVGPILGALVILEWAYHFQGAGSLAVESARDAHYSGLLVTSVWMLSLTVFLSLLREILEEIAEQAQ